jgi:hypothetical protein
MAISRYSSRSVILGVALLAFGFFVGYDTLTKLGWAHVQATLVSAEPKCQMTSEQTGILTKTTSTATIDCQAVEAFKILHPEKDWTLKKSWMLNLVVAGSRPVATSMLVFDDLHLKPGDALSVIQDPTDSARVLRADQSGHGFALAATMMVFGLLALLHRLLRRGRRPPTAPLQNGEPEAKYAPPPHPPSAMPPTPGAPRPFGRRGRNGA